MQKLHGNGPRSNAIDANAIGRNGHQKTSCQTAGRQKTDRRSPSGINRYGRVAGALIAVSTVLGVLAPGIAAPSLTAYAATTSVTVQSLTNEIVSLAQREQQVQAVAGPLISLVQSLTTTDLEQVMFNTTTLSASQQQTATALLSSIQTMLSPANAGNATQVQGLVQSSVTALVNLNSAQITSNDALNYFNQLVQNGVSQMASLALSSQGTVTKQQVIAALGSAVAQSGSVDPAILALLPGSSGSTSSGAPSGTGAGGQGTAGGASTGSGSAAAALLKAIGQAFSRTLTEATVGTTGGTVQVTNQGSTIQVSVPAAALSQQSTVTLGAATSGTDFSKVLPPAYNVSLTLSVAFSDPLQQPAAITVTDASIQPGTAVYEVTTTGLQVVPATVSQGKLTLPLAGNANLVLVAPQPTPSMKPSQRALMFDGKVQNVVPAFVKNQTTYMPIWYVMHLLNGLGFTSNWSTQKWDLSTNGLSLSNVKTVSPNAKETGIYLDGKLMENAPTVAATDPSTGHATTYMPVWYVMQLLNQVNIPSEWDSKTWYLAASYTPPAQ
ncbi:hypothetical protein JZ785_20150 [Alicyclobacillus curvatus]|nr:hypothetical protein JZ785_20150 [Alicyclobacillus curvatus]